MTQGQADESVASAETPQLREPEAADPGSGLDMVIDVELRLTVELGCTKLMLRDVLQLGKGSVVELDRDSGDAADIRVNGRLIARGDVTTVDDRLAVRIVDVLQADAPERGD